jgi:hypothetical protein
MIAEHGYANVNGPSVIRVPTWVENPLGRYYMYFAHHRGSFIRLAYAERLEGPWTVADEHPLVLAETPALDHIASPDVHVDDDEQVIRMYFHSVDDTTRWVQTTYLAVSRDGRKFAAKRSQIGPPYMRLFHMGTTWWAIAKVRGGPGGLLLRSNSPEGPFHVGPNIIPGMRHAAVVVDGDTVQVFFSRIGDRPERILVTSFDPERRWISEEGTPPRDVIWPQRDYEGVDLPRRVSVAGEASEPVRALRDPYVFTEDGEHHLFYSIAGENGIALARLEDNRVGPTGH